MKVAEEPGMLGRTDPEAILPREGEVGGVWARCSYLAPTDGALRARSSSSITRTNASRG